LRFRALLLALLRAQTFMQPSQMLIWCNKTAAADTSMAFKIPIPRRLLSKY
jgi:hypothetical protein